MSKIRRNTIQVINPLPGGASYTTQKSADDFVRRGLAVFEANDGAIRFLDQDRRIIRGEERDRSGGEFWWRLGTTGGMTQQIGSIVFRGANKPRKAHRSL
jgi:hypothetical protein